MALASTASRSVLLTITVSFSHGVPAWYRLRPMQAMETEVKIRVADREALEQKLPALGFARITERTLERNTLYDTPDRELRNSRQILRIRQYGSKWVVTHKCVPSGLTEEGRTKTGWKPRPWLRMAQ